MTANAPVSSSPAPLDELKAAIRAALPDLDVVLGWAEGPDPLCHAPLFITREEDVDRLVFDPRCAPRLAGYLPNLRGRKVGIVARGCDGRSIVELLQEKLFDRDHLTVFGLHCTGALDAGVLRAAAREADPDAEATGAELGPDGARLLLRGADGQERTIVVPLREALQTKCRGCIGPDAECDHFFGPRGDAPQVEAGPHDTLALLEGMDMEGRFRFWEETMSRCIRCYACRSACPLCVCRDHCVAHSRDPHWLDQGDHPREKLLFQLIHALHTAGRCTGCGECERACPMGLPVMAFKEVLNRRIEELFDYRAGTDPEAVPPLFQFREEEERIKEKKW